MVDLCARFGDAVGGQVVEEFNKLQQLGAIDDYLEKFEELKALVLMKNPTLPIQYFINSFIGGLNPQIKSFTRAFNPQTLVDDVHYARLQEATIFALKIPEKGSHTHSTETSCHQARGLLPNPIQSSIGSKPAPPPLPHKPKTLTAAERAEKLAKGLCFFCDTPYERGHKCNIKKTQLFLIEIPRSEDKGMEEEGAIDYEYESEGETPHISVNDLCGNQSFQTMRVTGTSGKTSIHILIDSGSTHNFLDVAVAKKLGCKVEAIQPQPITVADGNKLQCLHVCRFNWRIHNAEFTSNVMMIPLGSCDMVVLGVQWLSQLGTVKEP